MNLTLGRHANRRMTALGDLRHAGWLQGLKLAAVAVVAQAVWGMGRHLCPDRTRRSIAVTAAALLLFFPGAPAQIGVIFTGGILGWWFYRKNIPSSDQPGAAYWRQHLVAGALLVMFFVLLFTLPVVASTTGQKDIAVFDSFYRAGSLVFGGGHVILPLLRAEVVPTGWVADNSFLAGYGAAQALPGPLFTFAGFLGTAIDAGPSAWMGGLWCLLAIFLPGWLLIAGTLPFRTNCGPEIGLRLACVAPTRPSSASSWRRFTTPSGWKASRTRPARQPP